MQKEKIPFWEVIQLTSEIKRYNPTVQVTYEDIVEYKCKKMMQQIDESLKMIEKYMKQINDALDRMEQRDAERRKFI